MTILVTGGTGLVGSRLLKRLVEAGIDCLTHSYDLAKRYQPTSRQLKATSLIPDH